jgi:phosphoesterase RecJ-like protein
MRIDINECAKKLLEQDNILIITHAHPDGDTLGSGFALCKALLTLGKKARVICADEIPSKYLSVFENFEMPEFEEAFIVAVDVATINLLGDFTEVYGNRIDLCIDHHNSNTDFAKYLLLENAAAACETVMKVIKALGVAIDKTIASCLFMGISTDTGCFRYASTTAETFKLAAELIEFGADNANINRVMFETKSKTYAAIERLALEGMQFFCNDRVCIITVTQDMYRQTGSKESETEALPSLTRQIEGVEIGLTVREKENGECKCSIRTFESVNAASLAAFFGGGGHNQAAACRFECSVEEAKKLLVAKCEELLK